MKITVIYSLPTRRALASPYLATEEDTRASGEEVAAALRQKGVSVTLVPVAPGEVGKIRKLTANCIFNLVEWTGLDLPLSLAVLAELETLGIPFTGATLANFVMTADKVKMKEVMDTKGYPTPKWQLFTTGNEPVRSDFGYPTIVKLGWEHCSIGITRDAVVTNVKTLVPTIKERVNVFRQPVYVEEFIAGREFQVTILEKDSDVWVLPIAEIVFDKDAPVPFLTYASRWQEEHPEYEGSEVKVAKLPPGLEKKLAKWSKKIFRELGFRDFARFDVRTRGAEIFFLEINSNPGLGDDDDYGMTVSYKAAGLTFADFVWEIVQSALRRPSR